MSLNAVRYFRVLGMVSLMVLASHVNGQEPTTGRKVSTVQLSKDVTGFLGREIAAHVADIHSLDPPQERVVGALTVGEFSWGAFSRSLGSYSALSGDRTLADRDVPKLIGQVGLIEAKGGGKTFAQLNAAMALRHFGTDLNKNAVWQSLTPDEQAAWRSLLDPSRFYDSKKRKVIKLPENYFGVAARVVAIDYQLGLINDRAFVDDILDRAAEQFTNGSLYSDDGLPTGRFDRYSNEYARYVYLAAEDSGRKDLMKALEPTLKTQMKLWWDLISFDGYGYPWGRSLGAISYMDTMEIVGFLAEHPQFRPARLEDLASAYNAAWIWLRHDFQQDRHLLNVLGFGRGNYSYINKQREWQQTTAFFGKIAGAQIWFEDGMKREGITEFSADVRLPDVAHFEFFRRGDRPAGVWLVRNRNLHFALPIVSGTKPGVSDYLPAPYDLAGFAPPVEQQFPTMTPFVELDDGKIIVAGDCADEISPSSDGLSLKAFWRRWAVLGTKSGELVEPGLRTEVTWRIESGSLIRTEELTSTKPTTIRHLRVAIPSTGEVVRTQFKDGRRVDSFSSGEGTLEVSVTQSTVAMSSAIHATGDAPLGKGSRGPVPMYLELEAHDLALGPGKPFAWTLVLRSTPK
jgi:hypothetical protein